MHSYSQLSDAELDFWRGLETFELRDLAWLFFDLRPNYEIERHKRPLMVREMEEKILYSVEMIKQPEPDNRPGDMVILMPSLKKEYTRAALLDWCQQNGRPLPQFLTSNKPAPDFAKARRLIPMQALSKRDDWFCVIRDCIHEFEREKGFTPNEAQAWGRLFKAAPGDYGIEITTRDNRPALALPDGRRLDRESFHKRFLLLYPGADPDSVLRITEDNGG